MVTSYTHRRTLLVLLIIIIIALAVPLAQSIRSPEPRQSSGSPMETTERTPSAPPHRKSLALQIISTRPNRCATPISLGIGQIDEQFNVDAAVLTDALENAVNEWNTARADPCSSLVITATLPSISSLMAGKTQSTNLRARSGKYQLCRRT